MSISWRSLARGLGLIRTHENGKPGLRRRAKRAALRLESLEERLTMNNRFVVPFELAADNVATFHSLARALTVPGLVSGDIIEIAPNSTPGTFTDSNLPAVTNLTIRGNKSFSPRDLPQVYAGDLLMVDAPQAGLKLENLNLVLGGTASGGLSFNANGSLLSSVVTYVGPNTNDAITLNATTAAVLRNNTIVRATLGIGGSSDLIQVNTAASGANVIAGNTLQVFSAVPILHYVGNNTITDRVEDNLFIGNEPTAGAEASTVMLFVEANNGLTIQRNVFRDPTNVFSPIAFNLGVQNLKVLHNRFEFAGASTSDTILQVGANATAGLTTSVTLAHNQFRGPGRAIAIRHSSSGTLNVKVEGNDFIGSSLGVFIQSTGGSLTGVDLGGGSQGSLGANNFRIFKSAAASLAAAISVDTGTSALGAVQAKNNLFGTANPETVVFDNGDEPMRADVVTTGALTGNAAYVQALYLRFLKRVGDLADPTDAGRWVTQLNGGATSTAVANAIVRSKEALGHVVDNLYRTILGRAPTAANRTAGIDSLRNGTTIEQLEATLFASAAYRLRFAGDAAYVTSLYQTLLGRSPTTPELNSQTAKLATQGRKGVAASLLNSNEFRTREVKRLFTELLKRTSPPTANEVSAVVNSNLDLLSIHVNFAARVAFKANG